MDTVSTIAWNVSYMRRDGGGIRVQAFVEALRRLGVTTTQIGIGPTSVESSSAVTTSRLGDIKRQFFPVPLRRRAVRGLGHPAGDALVSLVSATHQFALDAGLRCWIDYPDLWSEYAANATVERGLFARATSNAQSRLWARREQREASMAAVVTTASWADANNLPGAEWLPTPTYSGQLPRRTAPIGRKTLGMLANFDYPPNRLAYQTLLEDWLPSLPQGMPPVVVAGFGSDTLPSHPLVHNKGPVSGVDEFYDNVNVVLAPVDGGGGMKVKVVESLSFGVPVVASPHAVDGLPPELAEACTLWRGSATSMPGDEDPRLNARVSSALGQFQDETFYSRVAELSLKLELSPAKRT